ncbi:hypothetical protein B0A48_10318 [Cryoendolithus antarcticus]|uniref:Subtelomeric hrmA-associated cluster protein AFUB-079030/YDR124W-like helical bundle domain-containing protein n=1 Tax=Cryoendolithus antarcticus TaxID=1507870 RepID=A0A1V8SWW7_9PEZI|nr:hypothetical protein B0A48_10318 [Cryoendolithus antarcticus]
MMRTSTPVENLSPSMHIRTDDSYMDTDPQGTSSTSGSRWSTNELMNECNQLMPLIKRKIDSAVVSESHDDALAVTTVQAQRCRIDDAVEVENFLRECLKNLQQLVVKAIAKAWIKGICPKKQAKFPYRSNRQNKTDVMAGPATIPPWWPKKEMCPFVEPDHIGRNERLNLCVHLLRLRPTPDQLAAWNNDSAEIRNTHRTQGWTEFLQELAGESVVCAAGGPGDKEGKRKDLLNKLYYVAKLEQDFIDGNIDGDAMFFWTPEPSKPVAVKKAKHSAVSTTDSETESSEITLSGLPTRHRIAGSPASVGVQDNKRVPTASKLKIENSEVDTTIQADIDCRDSTLPAGTPSRRARRRPVPRRRQTTDALRIEHHDLDRVPRHIQEQTQPWYPQQVNQSVAWNDRISPAESFASSYHLTDQHGRSISFEGEPDIHYQSMPEYGHQHADVKQHMPIGQQTYAVDMVHHIPQPQFSDTVPNTPIVSSGGFSGHFIHHMPPPHQYHGVEAHGLPTPMHPPGMVMPESHHVDGFQYHQHPQPYAHHDQQAYQYGPSQHYEQYAFRPDTGIRPHDLHQHPIETGHPQQYITYPVMDPHQHAPGVSGYCVDINGALI